MVPAKSVLTLIETGRIHQPKRAARLGTPVRSGTDLVDTINR